MTHITARFCLLLTLLPAVPHHAAAGPWPRGEGKGFLAFSSGGNDLSLWLEYGLRPDIWLTFEGRHERIGLSAAALSYSHHLMAHKSFTLSQHTRGEILYLSGWGILGYTSRYSLSAGLSFSGRLNGWATLEAGYQWASASQALFSDWSFGVQLTPRLATLAQGELRGWPGQFIVAKSAFSAVVTLRPGLRLVAGVWQSSTGQREVRIGSWLDF